MTTDESAGFDRLRGADPAAGTEPDLDKIHAAVAAATGVPLAGGPGARPDERAARRRGARTRWFQVAAAVAAVAVVGSGGYLVGHGAGGTASTALPPITLNGAGAGDSSAEMADAPAAGPMAASGAARDSALKYPGYWGRTVFTGQGLSTQGGSATAYGFDATSVANADTAARVAAALGVAGEPRVEWGSWVVGPNDGSGPTVTVGGDGLASLSYYDPTRDPWLCQDAAGTSSPGAVGGAGSVDAPAPADLPAPEVSSLTREVAPVEPARPAPGDPSVCDAGATPTGDAAIARARDALASLGVDASGAEAAVEDSSASSADGQPGAAYVWVNLNQVIDGQQTGVSWSVTLVGDGVQSVYAPLATLVELGSYDVVSAAAAVERLGDPRFGASGGVIALAAESRAVGDAVVTDQPGQEPTVPPAPTAGAPISWPVQQVTITSARLGLGMATLSTGAQVLVPSYALSDAQGNTWSVIAVVEAQLDFTTP